MKNLCKVSVVLICLLGIVSCKKNAAKYVQGSYVGTLIIGYDTTYNHLVEVSSVKKKNITLKSETDKFNSFSVDLRKAQGTEGGELRYDSDNNFDSNQGIVTIIGNNLIYSSGDVPNHVAYKGNKK